MAEINARDMHADSIKRLRQFTEAENFPNRLIRDVRTRLNHLHDTWEHFQRVHLEVLQVVQDEEQRAPHLRLYQEIEDCWFTADAIMQERIHEFDNVDVARNDNDAQSEHSYSMQNNGSGNDSQNGREPPMPQHHQQPAGPPPVPQVGQYVNAAPGNAVAVAISYRKYVGGIRWRFHEMASIL